MALGSSDNTDQRSYGQKSGMSDIIARLHIALADTDPLIWRRAEVPVEASLKMLHNVIQAAMGWRDCHLWEFEARDRRYGVPDPDWGDDSLLAANNTKLRTLINRDIQQFLYTYDMGDNWQHIVTVEAVEDGQPGTIYPRYVEGEHRAPPEDSGGTPGFEAFLEAILDPKHPDYEDAAQWHLSCYGKPFVPDEIDEPDAKRKITSIAKRRIASKSVKTRKPT